MMQKFWNLGKKQWRSMVAVGLMTAGLGVTETVYAESCPIIPIPDHYQSLPMTVALPVSANGVIVIASQAAEPVQFAAERLQTSLVRLTGRKYEIVHAVPANAQLVIRLGECSADPAIAEFCRQEKLDTAALTPKRDGFVIGFSTSSQPQIIGVAGSNPRSVIYGQDALTMLLQKQADSTYQFQAANVVSNAKIQWRSFAWNQCSQYLRPGVLDAYADARLNCIELRDGPPPMRGQFGYPVAWKIDGKNEKDVLREAHRRGMFVYGVVCCGVPDKDADSVLAKFKQLIELGADGIYISFDDPGTSGNAVNLVKRILKLAREHHISHDRIAFLPPAPDYGNIYTDFNQSIVKNIPEAADIRWFFTTTPTPERNELVKELGLRVPTGLFFNWPMFGRPEAMRMYDFEWSYICVPEFDDCGGARHTLANFQNAHQTIDSVMVWVREYPEYLAQEIGTWAWNPPQFTYQLARQRIYSRVYGADLASTVDSFDNYMTMLKLRLTRIGPFDWCQCAWRMSSDKSRPYALYLLKKLDKMQQEIAAKAPSQTLLSQETLRKGYLNPMRKSLDWARLLVTTDFPEDACPNFDRDYKWEKEHHTGVRYITYWKKKLDPLIDNIEKRLGKEKLVKKYVDDWRKKLTIPKE